MRLTTKGRFAVTAMMDIALQEGVKPVTLGDISERQRISLSYLEQLFGKLRRSSLVTSVRGPGGGYRINQPITSITVGEIIRAVDEIVDATQCGVVYTVWSELSPAFAPVVGAIKCTDVFYIFQEAERKSIKVWQGQRQRTGSRLEVWSRQVVSIGKANQCRPAGTEVNVTFSGHLRGNATNTVGTAVGGSASGKQVVFDV